MIYEGLEYADYTLCEENGREGRKTPPIELNTNEA